MNKLFIAVMIGCGLASSQASPITSEEGSTLVQQQAQQNYDHHQEAIKKQDYGPTSLVSSNGYNPDGSYGITFDNQDKVHRDRGYGYEKAYAYSRETAFFDFYDDKGALNARDIVEKYGDNKEEDLLKNVSS